MNEDITPIAHLIGVGPFTGNETSPFHEQAFLYELYPPLEKAGYSLLHVVVSCIDEDDWYGAETVTFKTDNQGELDTDYYAEYGPVLSLYSTTNPEVSLARLGYDLVAIRDGVLG